MRRHFVLLLIMIFAGITFAFAQEDDSVLLKGKIEQISEDGSYITIDGQKVLTTKELAEEAYFELGDRVEIKAENSQEGLRVLSYEYIYEEDLGYDEGSEETYSDQDSLGQ